MPIALDPPPPLGGWQRLGHGYRIEARINVFMAEDATKIALSAFFLDGDLRTVVTLANDRARLRHPSAAPAIAQSPWSPPAWSPASASFSTLPSASTTAPA